MTLNNRRRHIPRALLMLLVAAKVSAFVMTSEQRQKMAERRKSRGQGGSRGARQRQ